MENGHAATQLATLNTSLAAEWEYASPITAQHSAILTSKAFILQLAKAIGQNCLA
jgi:hypothetical protein